MTQRENVVAVTEDDSAGPPPAAGRAGTDEAVAPAGEPAGEAGEVGGAAQADAHGEPSGQDGQDEPGGRDEPGEAVVGDTRAVADAEDGEADEDDGAEEDGEEAPGEPGRAVADLEQEQEIAADYLEGLLDIVGDPDSEFDMGVEGDRALVSVVGGSLRELVGPRGEVLEALQELTRLAVHRQTGVRTRLANVPQITWIAAAS